MKTLFITFVGLLAIFGCKNNSISSVAENQEEDQINIEVQVDEQTKIAQKIFELEISDVEFAIFRVKEFQKVDGYAQNYFGMDYYHLEFKAISESSEDVEFYHRYSSSRLDIADYKIDFPKDADQVDPERARDPWFQGRSMKFNAWSPIPLTGTISLQKTENGWRKAE